MVANGKLYTAVMEKLNSELRLDATNITISVKDPGRAVLGGTAVVSELQDDLRY